VRLYGLSSSDFFPQGNLQDKIPSAWTRRVEHAARVSFRERFGKVAGGELSYCPEAGSDRVWQINAMRIVVLAGLLRIFLTSNAETTVYLIRA